MSTSGDDGDRLETQRENADVPVRYCLEHPGGSVALGSSAVLVGRSSACHVVLDDGLVSRQHARFLLHEQRAMVEDLGSVNGVYLNGQRISERQTLRDGDRVQIGKEELVLRAVAAPAPTVADRFLAETLHGQTLSRQVFNLENAHHEQTRRADALDLLCGVADKTLALGRGDEAEKLLGATLARLLDEAETGSLSTPAVAARAVGYAVRIADATGRGRWVDYCFRLYTAHKRLLPGEVVEELYSVLRKVSGVGMVGFRRYLSEMRDLAPSLSVTERFALQRLEGLEPLIAR